MVRQSLLWALSVAVALAVALALGFGPAQAGDDPATVGAPERVPAERLV